MRNIAYMGTVFDSTFTEVHDDGAGDNFDVVLDTAEKSISAGLPIRPIYLVRLLQKYGRTAI